MVAANTPLGPRRYVPILKTKGAEVQALAHADPSDLVPILEVLDFVKGAGLVSKGWPHSGHVAWIHPFDVGEGTEDAFYDAVDALFLDIRGVVSAVPVVVVAEEPAYLTRIRAIIETDRLGAVLRVDVEEMIDDAADTAADIESTLDALGLAPSQADLVLDGGLLEGTAVVQARLARLALDSVPRLAQWRSIVVSFSGFPATVGDVVPSNSVRAIPRIDAEAFTTLAPHSAREVTYSDYAVGTPSHLSVPFAPVPNIKYASGDSWHIHRGGSRKNPSPQYRKLAADVVSAAYYTNETSGDQAIADVASGASGPGNATTHLAAAVSRHLHVVSTRLATLGVP
jgi:hypothetical protein